MKRLLKCMLQERLAQCVFEHNEQGKYKAILPQDSFVYASADFNYAWLGLKIVVLEAINEYMESG